MLYEFKICFMSSKILRNSYTGDNISGTYTTNNNGKADKLWYFIL